MKRFLLIALMILLFTSISTAGQLTGTPVSDQDYWTSKLGATGNCGPNAMTEVLAYWGTHGYPNLLKGSLSGRVPDNSAGMEALFVEALDYSQYEKGRGTKYKNIKNGIIDYFQDHGYTTRAPGEYRGFGGGVTWNRIKSEINAGRPPIILAWGWNHYFVPIGYTENPRTMTVLYGHGPKSSKGPTDIYGNRPFIRKLAESKFPYFSNCHGLYITPSSKPSGSVPPPPPPVNTPDPTKQSWYPAAKAWCDANGFEIEVRD